MRIDPVRVFDNLFASFNSFDMTGSAEIWWDVRGMTRT